MKNIKLKSFTNTLNELSNEFHNLAIEKGWYRDLETFDQFIERTCNNLHDEVCELHTAWRENKINENCDKPIKLSYLEEELADIIIRVLDAAANLRINIGRAVYEKHSYNKMREYRHGNKKS